MSYHACHSGSLSLDFRILGWGVVVATTYSTISTFVAVTQINRSIDVNYVIYKVVLQFIVVIAAPAMYNVVRAFCNHFCNPQTLCAPGKMHTSR